MNNKTKKQLLEENQDLRARLEESEEALRAIRSGEVDALVIYGSTGEQVYTLQGADHTYRVMVESISEGAASALKDGTLLYCNRRLAEMLGVPLETLPGTSLARFVAPEDTHIFESLLEQGQAKSTRAEVYLKSQNSPLLQVLLSVSPAEMDGDWGLCLIATDLTLQKRSEAILASERLARSILDQAGEAIVVCDPDGIVIRASQVACDLIQKNPLLHPFEQAFPLGWSGNENYREGFTIQSVLRGKAVQGIEASLDQRTSHLKHLLVSAAPLRNEREEILGCIVTLNDITARKRAEIAMQTSERTLKLFVDYAPASIAMFDRDMQYIAASRRWRIDYRLGEQNIIGQSHYAIFPEISEQWKEIHRRCLAGAVEKCDEDPFPRADGSMDWVRWEIHPWYNDAGEIGGIIMFTEVITERKQATAERERLLAENQRQKELLERLIQVAPVGIAVLEGPEHRFVLANPGQYRLFPTVPNFIGHTVSEIWPSQIDIITPILDRIYQTGEPYYAIDAPWQTDYGQGPEWAFYTFSYSPLYSPDGAIEGILVLSVDTTEQVKIHQELEEERDKLQAVLEQSPCGVTIAEAPSGKLVLGNSQTQMIWRHPTFKASESISDYQEYKGFHPDGRPYEPQEWPIARSILTGEVVHEEEIQILRGDGTLGTVLHSTAPIYKEGKIISGVAIINDITERKQWEQERERLLAENRRQKELLVAQSNIDPGGQALVSGPHLVFQYINPAYRALTPHPQTDPLSLPYNQVWPPEEGYAQQDAIQQVLASGVKAQIQRYERRYPDGTTHYFAFHIHPMEWDGEPAAYLVLWDTTELVRIQEALRESQERFEMVIRSSPISIYTTDRELRYTWIYNPHSGLHMEDPIGKKDEDLLPMDQVRELIDLKHHVLTSGAGARKVIRTEAAGQEEYHDVAVEPLVSRDGEILGLSVCMVDTTSIYKLQQEMQEKNARLEVQHLLIDQIEQERQRISRELHDGPLQELISITFDLQNAISDAKDVSEEQTLQAIQKSMKTQIDNLRSFASNLRPPVLNKFGLERAIRSYLEKFEKKHPEIRINFDAHQTGPILSEPIRVAMFRILQEAMNNIVRHAQAGEISIRMEKDLQKVDLTIEDNGHGFSVPANLVGLAHQGHFGLVGIQERADSIHGKLKIISKPGQGTWIRISVPIDSPLE